jgi:ribosome-binding protein aMBF1 (putative translation factor)
MKEMAKPSKKEKDRHTPTPVPLIQLVAQLENLDVLEELQKNDRDKLMKKIRKAMREHRESAKLSVRELAGRIGCSAPFITDMELGHRRYSVKWCRKVMHSINGKAMDKEEPT